MTTISEGTRAVVAADAAHWRAWQLLGHARYALGEREGAIEAYRQSLALNPGNAELKAWAEQISPP